MPKSKKPIKKTQKQLQTTIEIQDLLYALDTRDVSFFLKLTEKQQNSVPLQEVVLRWLSVVGNSKLDYNEARRMGRSKGDGKGPWPSNVYDTSFTEYYLSMTNVINKIMGNHELDKHPILLWKLFSIIGCGTKQEHVWLPLNKENTDTPTIDYIIRKKYPLCSNKELNLLKSQTTNEEFIEMVKGYGNPSKLSKKEVNLTGKGVVLDEDTVYKELKKLGK